MTTPEVDIVIIGAGLSGLSLAYYLRETGLKVKILEGRNRLGGRINTVYREGNAPLEMGATWLGEKHKSLIKLLNELGLKTFKQEMGSTAVYEPISTSPHQIVSLPPNNSPSFRVIGGTSTLINQLANKLEADTILLDQKVNSIQKKEDVVLVSTSDKEFIAQIVVSTLPPNLLTNAINIYPQLPNELISISETTHTWMGESIKIALTYKTPFWRENNLSGTIVSNVGPIPEMYDHSNYEDSKYALKGFLNGNYYSVTQADRLQMILNQLSKYYGPQVNDHISYEESIWREEEFTFSEYNSHVLPHQNNGHPLFHKPYLDGNLYIGGAETAIEFPGYMDGAVASAKRIAKAILNQ